MKPGHHVFRRQLRHAVAILALGAVPFGSLLLAQKNSVQPQPRADRLPPVAVPTPSRGALVDKPAAVMPAVPAGFTVSIYAELQAPRMMVYAPNGDLFVSSPATNSITVLRDANNDGVFEQRGVYAQGEAAGRGAPRRRPAARRQAARGAGAPPAPLR